MTARSERSSWRWSALMPTMLTLVIGGVFLSRSSIWTDEAATWANSRMPISAIFHYTLHTEDAVFLPYYLLMHAWMGISQQLWWLRLPSLLAAAATSGAVTLLMQRWAKPIWALLGGILLALNPLFLRWAIEARPYAIATLFAVLSTWALLTAVERGGRRNWALYGVFSLCMLLFHLLAILVLIAQAPAILVTKRRSAWIGQVLSLASVVIVISPLAVVAAGQTAQVSWIPPSTPGTFFMALAAVSGGHTPAIGVVACILVVLGTTIYRPTDGDEQLRTLLMVAWAVLPPVLLVALGFLHPTYVDRYLLVCVPGVAIIEAMAAERVWRLVVTRRSMALRSARSLGSQLRRPSPVASAKAGRWSLPTVVAVVVIAAIAVAPLWLARTSYSAIRQPYFYDDFRTAAAVLQSDLRGRDPNILVVDGVAGQGFAFYLHSPRLQDGLLQPSEIPFPKVTRAERSVPAPPGRAGIIWSSRSATGSDTDTGCANILAIGRNPLSNPSIEFEGRACRLSDLRYFGQVWVARARTS
jgi:uncharacterized membrane protein